MSEAFTLGLILSTSLIGGSYERFIGVLRILEIDLNDHEWEEDEAKFAILMVASAALAKDKVAVRNLLNLSLKINDTGNFGFSALRICVNRNDIEAVKILVAEGANVNAINAGDTALEVSEREGYDEMTSYLRSIGAKRKVDVAQSFGSSLGSESVAAPALEPTTVSAPSVDSVVTASSDAVVELELWQNAVSANTSGVVAKGHLGVELADRSALL